MAKRSLPALPCALLAVVTLGACGGGSSNRLIDPCPGQPGDPGYPAECYGFEFRDKDCDNVEDAPGGSDTVFPNDDADSLFGDCDLCPAVSSADSRDSDRDTIGNPCDVDDDNDGVSDATDNCRLLSNPSQASADTDADGRPDTCDNCLDEDNAAHVGFFDCNSDGDSEDAGEFPDEQCDRDRDSLGDTCDNCPDDPNSSQADADGDGTGDACEGA